MRKKLSKALPHPPSPHYQLNIILFADDLNKKNLLLKAFHTLFASIVSGTIKLYKVLSNYTIILSSQQSYMLPFFTPLKIFWYILPKLCLSFKGISRDVTRLGLPGSEGQNTHIVQVSLFTAYMHSLTIDTYSTTFTQWMLTLQNKRCKIMSRETPIQRNFDIVTWDWNVCFY